MQQIIPERTGFVIIGNAGTQMTEVWETRTHQETNPRARVRRTRFHLGQAAPGPIVIGGLRADRQLPEDAAEPGEEAGDGDARAASAAGLREVGRGCEATPGREGASPARGRCAPRLGAGSRRPGSPPAACGVYLSLGGESPEAGPGTATAPTLFLLLPSRPPRPGSPRPPAPAPGRPSLHPPDTQTYWPASPHHTAAVAPPHTAPRFHLPPLWPASSQARGSAATSTRDLAAESSRGSPSLDVGPHGPAAKHAGRFSLARSQVPILRRECPWIAFKKCTQSVWRLGSHFGRGQNTWPPS